MRTNKNNTLNPNVFQKARHLFGAELQTEKELKETKDIKTKLFVLPDTSGKLMAVYPAIIEEAFAATMDNYRKYVALKNFQSSDENDHILTWNKNVRIFKKENMHKLSEVQLQFSKQFPKTYKPLDPTTYNQKVDEFTAEYGMLVQKKKMITIKPTAELVFQNLLVIYNQQLMKRNERYIRSSRTTKTPVEPFSMNAWKVTQLKRNGVKSLDLCRKTINNHKKRFLEFGVFTSNIFHGSKFATETEINPEILVVKDIFNQKLMRAENQSLTSSNGKIVTDENEKFTRTFIKEAENEKKVENCSSDKEFPSVTPFILSFTGTPAGNDGNSTEGAAAESVKVLETPSEIALSTILPDNELAKAMENHEFNNYKPIDIRFLYKLALNSTLTREEFYDVVLNDIFKSIQKNIYKTQPVFFGSWYNAIQCFRKQRWILFNGDVYQKQHLVEEVQQYRWRIQWARNWFGKNKTFNPLFPNQYLDVTRKNAKEVGFEYTKIKWKQQQDDTAKYDALLKKQEADAKRRGLMINYSKKMETQLNRFFKDKITLNSLYEYVEKNLPPEYLQKLPDLIETKALAINKKIVEVKYNLNDFL